MVVEVQFVGYDAIDILHHGYDDFDIVRLSLDPRKLRRAPATFEIGVWFYSKEAMVEGFW